ncbi:response regulator [Frigoriglobus tundricola]|uniref:Response regulatory domain-containing protein n=1 Tax=Frigoriglobus tundricola TaxID=2774151 RepID=A0A6M5YMA7_9BACT|nr:response regulator [Frigoriglobus tundricola]QJW95187.1 hypothetical protein FTUN_2726 [Frigoriglobus tundricola]
MRAAPPPLRILVVDDCPDTAYSFAELLRLHGFDTRSAGSGGVALALCAAWRPDVVLLDLWMPGVNGFEVARQLREREGAMRLVAVTGLATHEYRERAAAAGFQHFLVKPVEPAVLVDLLREWAATPARRLPRHTGAAVRISPVAPAAARTGGTRTREMRGAPTALLQTER